MFVEVKQKVPVKDMEMCENPYKTQSEIKVRFKTSLVRYSLHTALVRVTLITAYLEKLHCCCKVTSKNLITDNPVQDKIFSTLAKPSPCLCMPRDT